MLGAGLIPLAVFCSLLIGVVMIIFANRQSFDSPYILVVNVIGEDNENEVMKTIMHKVKKHVVKSKTVRKDNNIELSVEVRLRDSSTGFVNDICKLNGVEHAVLVSYNGEYMN